MSVPVFRGSVRDGNLRMNDVGRWHGYLASLEGRFIRVVVERETTRRSNNQNRWYRGVIVPEIRKYLNEARGASYTNDQIHEVLKAAFIGTEETPLGPVPTSTASLTVEQFSEFCNRIVAHCATEWGLPIPSPGEVEVAS